MGCSFNCVIVPAKVQKVDELENFYESYKNKLLKKYGEDFEGYSGDLCVDDGLKIKSKVKIKIDNKKELKQKDVDYYYDQLIKVTSKHCKKWGPSIAIRLGDQWAICGFYSD